MSKRALDKVDTDHKSIFLHFLPNTMDERVNN